jgi:hypothetical protein
VDGQSHARPDRDIPVAAQPLGCDVTQQEGERERERETERKRECESVKGLKNYG